ncbi:UxaA family hydrolase [Steroidobacter sp.]|uniref:UxaA family hydrolase n=1 Tax=Steroidobacter sp. TaxID=1978227 RepID=UPI001A3C0A23|nr:UxaA family hydrolase [Steroidobacter sp.]MBL8269929.1 UxaA family hydrolase [Steroidobacter sp.]
MPRVAVPVILLHPDDNILVCRRSVTAGERFHINANEQIEAIQTVELGHKLARRALSVGEKVIKYGAPIGSITVAAQAGEWIHLHNMKSDYIGVHTRATSTSGP